MLGRHSFAIRGAVFMALVFAAAFTYSERMGTLQWMIWGAAVLLGLSLGRDF